ncbi:DUF4129 domain-containing protein [Halomicrococcus gelatinilyticus]|uniref:DUF4129 domain-containing protein n=1 Tax=Halomicrococcus gelatinilyticus TaxID=1702103 RepID=UPI002E0FCC9B
MDLDNARPIALALLCVLAIALAAATLNSAVASESSGGGGLGWGNDGSGVGSSDGSETGFGGSGGQMGSLDFPCYPILTSTSTVLAILAGFAVLVGIAYWRKGLLGAIAVVGPVGIPAFLVYALLTSCRDPEPRDRGILPGETPNMTMPDGGGASPGDGTATSLSPSAVLLLVLGVALVGAVVLLVRSSSGNELDEPPGKAVDDDADVAAVGRAAGDAADRIEDDASVGNEVYRAWREMTENLDVSAPQSSTPGEFATAAVSAGMARDDVDELTNLFEEVRYGGEAPTGEREERAVSALRRIEREYADDTTTDGAGDRT